LTLPCAAALAFGSFTRVEGKEETKTDSNYGHDSGIPLVARCAARDDPAQWVLTIRENGPREAGDVKASVEAAIYFFERFSAADHFQHAHAIERRHESIFAEDIARSGGVKASVVERGQQVMRGAWDVPPRPEVIAWPESHHGSVRVVEDVGFAVRMRVGLGNRHSVKPEPRGLRAWHSKFRNRLHSSRITEPASSSA